LKSFFKPILHLPDAIFVQSAVDYDRYAQLGAPADTLEIGGNLKYDVPVGLGPTEISTFDAEQVWIAASTAGPNERGSVTRHSVDEDEIAIRTFQALADEFPRLLLILAPRQPARFDGAALKLEANGIRFLRRTATTKDPSLTLRLPGVILLDTIGELASAYSLADVAFVGGSIAPRGGHNVIEPAAAGVPIVVGPHMDNFEAMARDFLNAEAMIQIQQEQELPAVIRELLSDIGAARALGDRARRFVESQRGASHAIADRLRPLFCSACLKPPRGLLSRCILGSLAFLWREGGVIRRRRSEHRLASMPPLPAPVVSIGGITVGGSGKTPFTTYLATRLGAQGYSPAILTRGYRRRSPAENLVFAPGAKVPPAFTGDEAQIFLRSGIAPVGIGANRHETARILFEQFPRTNVFLLDDGFQHARIGRDFDVVVIDGLDPFGQDEVVPLGRLREPLQALGRASAFVVNRAEADLRYEAIAARLSEYNSSAPIFRTRLMARGWRDYRSGASIPSLSARRVAAFCGLGNPENFWATLESLGLDVVFRWAFRDHHPYKPFELQRIAHQARVHGAEILVTTEKDRINCPNNLESAIAPLDLAWLEIELQLENEAAFLKLLSLRCLSA
ncbi:MAG: tetraacyldisaccharide 4'-kinase, partial [Bryobacteraceae bacterium]